MTIVRCSIVPAAVWAAVCLSAQQTATNAAAETAIARMEAAYKTLPSLHIKARWSAKYSGAMSADDFPLPGPDSLELRMERPNKLYLWSTTKRDGKQSSYMVVSDGTTLTYWRSPTNSFIQKKAPETLSSIGGLLPDTAIGVTIDNGWEEESIPEWDLLADARAPSPSKTAAAQGAVLTMTGPEKLGNAQVIVIRMAASNTGVPIEIEQLYQLDAESYLLRGMATNGRGKHPENGRDFTVEMRCVYDLHTTQPAFAADAFRFVPPRGARPE